MDQWYDVRAEMKHMGHNLTSVLINPRDSLYDEMMDEFAYEQNEVSVLEAEMMASCVVSDEDMVELNILCSPLRSISGCYTVQWKQS
jgi:hypothetical protein